MYTHICTYIYIYICIVSRTARMKAAECLGQRHPSNGYVCCVKCV